MNLLKLLLSAFYLWCSTSAQTPSPTTASTYQAGPADPAFTSPRLTTKVSLALEQRPVNRSKNVGKGLGRPVPRGQGGAAGPPDPRGDESGDPPRAGRVGAADVCGGRDAGGRCGGCGRGDG